MEEEGQEEGAQMLELPSVETPKLSVELSAKEEAPTEVPR